MSAGVLPLPVRARTLWAEADRGFYVASRQGDFVGYIDSTADGSYIAFDGRSTPIGRFFELAQAKRAVVSTCGVRKAPLYGEDRGLHAAAAAWGALAAMLLVTAGSLAPHL